MEIREAETLITETRAVFAAAAPAVDEMLAFKSFPSSRRRFAVQQQERMETAAAGGVVCAYIPVSSLSLESAFKRLGGVDLEPWRADDNTLRDALDELLRLRKAAAFEAEVLHAHTYSASFPKGAQKVVDRLRASLVQAAGDTSPHASSPFSEHPLHDEGETNDGRSH